jgi:flavorubredoxin
VDNPYTAAPDIEVIPSSFEIPGYGLLAVNAFVLKGKEPLLVDTGYTLENAEFMDTLRSVIDPKHLKWIWLTHTDHDHIGSLHQLLDEVPDLRVITTFLAVGKMTLHNPLPRPPASTTTGREGSSAPTASALSCPHRPARTPRTYRSRN